MLAGGALAQQYLAQGNPERSVVFDNATNSGYKASLSTYSWTHVCGLSARGLLVNVSILVAGTVSSITYGGVSLTLVPGATTTSGIYRNEMWQLEGPVYGSNSIVVTLSTSVTSIASAVSYGNVDQLNMVENSAVASGIGGTPTLSVLTESPFAWVLSGITTSNTAVTPGSSQTQRDNNTGALGSGGAADRGPINPSASTAVNWSAVGGLDTWILSAVALNPTEDKVGLFSDTVGITDTFSERLSFLRSLSEVIGITNILTKHLAFLRSTSDTVGITDTFSKHLTFLRSFADTTGVTEAFSQHSTRQRNSNDTVDITETISGAGVYHGSLNDTIGLTDALVGTDTYLRSIANTVGIIDALVVAFNAIATLADTVGVTDNVLGRVLLRSTLNDTIGLTDALARHLAEGRALVDAPGITDALVKKLVFIAHLTDSFGLIDSLSPKSKHPSALADTIGISDSITRVLHFILGLSDTVGILESFSYINNAPGSAHLTDLIGMTDSVATLVVSRRVFLDTVGVAESFRTGSGTILSDVAGISAALVEHLTHHFSTADQVGITDHLFSGGIRVTLQDITGISDTLTFSLIVSHAGLVQPLKVIMMTSGVTAVILSDSGVTKVELQSSLLSASVIGG